MFQVEKKLGDKIEEIDHTNKEYEMLKRIMKRPNIWTTGTKDKSIEQVFKGSLEEKLPELRKDKLVHIQKAQSTK